MDKIRVVSCIRDEKIKAYNLLCEIAIGDYLEIAFPILDANEYQRKRVKDSKTVYSLLRSDLKMGCTIPPIVLAERNNTDDIESYISRNGWKDVTPLIKPENLMILDGLQRTFTLLDVRRELEEDKDSLERYLLNPIRIEIYVGIDKIGILYRMLTLNTGQTSMPIRHQVEILYSDLIKEDDRSEYKFYKQSDKRQVKGEKEFYYRDAVECFYAYMQRDPNGIDRVSLLDDISNLEKLSKENQQADLFMSIVKAFSAFLLRMNQITGNWHVDGENADDFSSIGCSIIKIFNKSVVMSGFGAAIGDLKDSHIINEVPEIESLISAISLNGTSPEETLKKLADIINNIKADASKIGAEQRRYYHCLFKYLFVDVKDGKCDFKSSCECAYRRYSVL